MDMLRFEQIAWALMSQIAAGSGSIDCLCSAE